MKDRIYYKLNTVDKQKTYTRVWNIEKDCREIQSRSPTVSAHQRTVAATSISVA